MQLSRREFLTNPLRSIRGDMARAGHWIYRARARTTLAPSNGGVEAGGGRSVATAARSAGLRESRSHNEEKDA
jgi:hypothetical protein